MSRKPFRVGKSPTGLGLFATEFIDKGTFIVEYKGRMLPDAVAGKLADRGAKYLYEINSRWTVDGSSRSNVARYANHSCRPNAESDVTRDKKIIIRSIKRIYPGDEITYDYGRDYFNLILKKIGCKCEKCQGIKARPPGPRPGWRATPANGHANGKLLSGKQLTGKQLTGKQLNGKQLNGKHASGNGVRHPNGKAKHLNGNGVTRANGHAPRGRNGKRH